MQYLLQIYIILDLADDYLESNIWTIIDYQVYSSIDDYNGLKFSQLHNCYTLLRNPTYQIFYMLVPTAVLSTLGSFSFLIPCLGGDKLNLSLTTLLAVSVFMLMIADTMPRASTSVPILSM